MRCASARDAPPTRSEIAATRHRRRGARDRRALERAVVAQAGPPVGERDPIFACVRGPDARVAAAQLFAASPDATIVNVQNGLDGDAVFAEQFPRVIGAVIRHNCTRVGMRVRARAAQRADRRRAHPEGGGGDVEAIAALLRSAGYDTGVSTRIAEDRWLKFCINLMSTPNALVRPADHETRAFTEGKARLLEEARDVLAAAGIAARSCDGRDRSLEAEIAVPARRSRARRRRPQAAALQRRVAGTRARIGAGSGRVPPPRRRTRRMRTASRRRSTHACSAGLERVVREALGSESLGAAELLGDARVTATARAPSPSPDPSRSPCRDGTPSTRTSTPRWRRHARRHSHSKTPRAGS